MIQDKHLQTNKEISEDTGRTPKERDLARILGVAEILLAREMFESAQAILRIYLEEFEETVDKFSADFNIFRYLPEFCNSVNEIESKMSVNNSNQVIYFHRDKQKKIEEEASDTQQVSENSDFIQLAQEEKYLDELDIAIIQVHP